MSSSQHQAKHASSNSSGLPASTTLPSVLLPEVLAFVPRTDLLPLKLHLVFSSKNPFIQPPALVLRRLLLAVIEKYVRWAKDEEDYRMLRALVLMWDTAVGIEADESKALCISMTRQVVLVEHRREDTGDKEEEEEEKEARLGYFFWLLDVLPTAHNHSFTARFMAVEETMRAELAVIVEGLEEEEDEDEDNNKERRSVVIIINEIK